MICDRVLGNIGDAAPGESLLIERVPVQWHQLARRALRLLTPAGERIDVLLAPGLGIGHDDIVFRDKKRIIVIDLLPIEVLVLHPRSPNELAILAARLGNEHIPMQILDGTISTPVDGPARALASAMHIEGVVETRRFHPIRFVAASI